MFRTTVTDDDDEDASAADVEGKLGATALNNSFGPIISNRFKEARPKRNVVVDGSIGWCVLVCGEGERRGGEGEKKKTNRYDAFISVVA